MSETTFTSGPWQIDKEMSREGWMILAKEGPLTVSPGTATGLPDAHLIAVAPQLYSALEHANALLRVLIPEDISVRETLADNETLLAKARGES